MKRSKEDAARTRQEIVEAASRLFRKKGIAQVSVADVMAEVGMTVGGFYRHFESKDALVAEAIELASLRTAGRQVPADELVRGYVSMGHVKNAADGCPVAALCSEISHEGPIAREAFTQAMRRMLEQLARAKKSGRREQLQSAAAAVGGVMLARASDDPKLAEEIVDAVRDGLLKATRG